MPPSAVAAPAPVAGAILSTTQNEVHRFLSRVNERNKRAGGQVTHTLITGAKMILTEGDDMQELRAHIADVIRYNADLLDPTRTCAPCLTELHTHIFPMYVDVDLRVPVAALARATIERIAAILCRQLLRFYPEADARGPLSRCVVCARSGDATSDAEGRYKHGLHLHWPEVVVEVDQARQILESMTAGLDREVWTEALGVARVDWEEALDRSVYNTGLRVIHCPKARKCTACNGKADAPCSTCGELNNRHEIDPRVYRFAMALQGGALSDEYRRELHAPLTRLVKATSVRVDTRFVNEVTPGYRIYDGCPPVRAGAGGKRKRPGAPGAPSADEKRLGRAYREREEVVHPAKLEIMRRLVTRHHPEYANSTLKVRVAEFKGVRKYSVLLSGDGSRYCMNKRDYHRGNNVFMEVWKDRNHSNGGARSVMRCWCRCPVVRVGGGPCGTYTSPVVPVEDDDARVLFDVVTKDPLATAQRVVDPADPNVWAAELLRFT